MPVTPAFVFTADLHLRPQTWTHHPDLRDDAYVSLEAICAYCRQVDLPLVIGGDIFNSRRPDPRSVREFNNYDGHPGIYYVQGNHDYCDGVTWPGVVDRANHMHRRTLNFGNGDVYGLDWTPRDKLAEELAAIPPEVSILVCHQAWDELQGIGNTDGSINLIPDHVKVLLTGDYHVALCKHFDRASGARLIVCSPGSTYMNKINEEQDKYALLCGSSGGEFDYERVIIPTRRKFDVTINTADELAEFCAHQSNAAAAARGCADLDERIRKPIFNVAFRDDIPGGYERLKAAIGDRYHFFPAPIHMTEEVDVDLTEDPDTFDTLLGAIGRLEEDPAIIAGATRLLNAPRAPGEEIELMMREHYDAARTAEAPA